MLEIEFEKPTESRCECCGTTTFHLTRFVYRDGDAYAVYYAQYTSGHANGSISGLIGLGPWGEGAEPEERIAFPFVLSADDKNYMVGLMNAVDSPWSDVTFLGRILDRDEALTHALVKDAFYITDHMVTEDQEIVAYLSGATGA